MPNNYRNILLYGSCERALFSKAIKEGLFDVIEIPDELLNYDQTLEMRYKRNPFKSAVLQMLLLFDKVILVAPLLGYNTDALTSTGAVDIIDIEDEPSLLGSLEWNEGERAYAMYLKPFLLARLVTSLSKKEKAALHAKGLSGRQFFSTLYDMSFSGAPAVLNPDKCRKVHTFIEDHSHSVYARQKPLWDTMRWTSERALDYIRFQWTFHITESAGTLMTLLEKSVLLNAALMQSEFRLTSVSNVGVVENLDSAHQAMGAYSVIRASYENAIGTLPKLTSISQVLHMKEKRAKDIRRLRSVLGEIEYSLRCGEIHAAQLAMNCVKKASRDLSRGTEVGKVSRWITYLSLPFSIAEMCLSLPPVAGIAVASAGVTSTFFSDKLKAKSEWIQVIR